MLNIFSNNMRNILLFLAFYSYFCIVVGRIPDWLVKKVDFPVRLVKDSNNKTLTLTNGIISRTFSLSPGFATIDLYSHEKNSSLLRALGPEGIVKLDDVNYDIGGIHTEISRAYLNRTALINNLKPLPNSFQFVGYEERDPVAPYPYKPKRGAPTNIQWPPNGTHVSFRFQAPNSACPSHKNVGIIVHYEIYVGAPIIVKWISIDSNSVENSGTRASILSVEQLAVNQQWADHSVNGYGWLFIGTDEPHGTVVKWSEESPREAGSFQPVVNAFYERNFSVILNPEEGEINSFRVLEMAVGTSDPERVGLARKRLTRMLAPQTMETPIYFHMTERDSTKFRETVDQLAEVGFDMIFYSFGSGFDLQTTVYNDTLLNALKSDIAYANSKGIEVGAYDLICWTRTVKEQWMAHITTPGYEGTCFASGWYDELLNQVIKVFEVANLTAIETDGPYPGYDCTSTEHEHHRDASDSIYHQTVLQGKFFSELRKREMFINQPDNYFFQGGSKSAMGYDEGQYSLPRWMDLSVSRQGLYDDTFMKTPTEGWMFLPLDVYHGGGDAAKFEPLSKNSKEYNFGLAQYFGAGIMACIRGSRIYDTPETKSMVQYWVQFYKKYHGILQGNIIHVKRADMQSIDGFLHVPDVLVYNGELKGLAMFFNPTLYHLKSYINLPLYYTGLEDNATVVWEESSDKPDIYQLHRDYSIDILIDMKPESVTYITIR